MRADFAELLPRGVEVDPHAHQRHDAAPVGGDQRARSLSGGIVRGVDMAHARISLQPGQRVLELAAGPGDTGFLAAELIAPAGTLISSDASEPMLEVARERAQKLGVENVEFRRLELEWIDLAAASVDAALCRWGVMLTVDPDAALREMRRVLRPGGRMAIAVWDGPERNPWATVWGRPMVELGHMPPPDRNAPGMFALADPTRLAERIRDAGFVDVEVESVEIPRSYTALEHYISEQLDLSSAFTELWEGLSEDQRSEVTQRVAQLAQPYERPDGTITFPAASLVAAASA